MVSNGVNKFQMSRLLGASREAGDQRLVDMAKEEVMLGLSESILIPA